MNLLHLLNITTPYDYKIHAARWNGANQPLDVFLRDKKEWHDWNRYFGKTHLFNRPYILSLMDFYPERNIWMFGGIYKVNNYAISPPITAQESHAYDTSLTEIGESLIGRLKVEINFSRRRDFKLESQVENMRVVEILRNPYSGPTFPGYEHTSLIFSDLTSIVKNDRQDWKTALQHIKGIYLITLKSGQHYIGSAYGNVGIWSRWSNYAKNGHGGNKEMMSLARNTGKNFISNARFTLIEAWPMSTEDCLILARENYWKTALSSRDHDGLNIN